MKHLAFGVVNLILFFCFFKSLEESEGTSTTTLTREIMELTGVSAIFYGHYFVVVEDNDRNV